jgi:hypothetical protein
MHVQLAESPAEVLLLVWRQVLVAEEDHAVLDQAVMDRLERRLVQRLREINAVDDGTGMRRELLGVYSLLCHV